MIGTMLIKMDELLDDPKKGEKLSARVSEAERDLEEKKKTWDTINASIDTEVKRFHDTTNSDFAAGLHAHIEQQLAFEDAQQERWRKLLQEFESVPS